MITIKQMRWSNLFSYGADNQVQFDNSPITQLVGKNGHGKSSVALILEEVLFNKNSKGIKKSDILNRYVKDKQYQIELDFDVDGDDYIIKTVRGPTQTVKLYKNGVDISSHTATSTYKSIEELLGMDHKAFSQIVYQSNASSLEFLTATDTIRKKFLIDLLDLGQYGKAADIFKEIASELTKDIAAADAKVKTVCAWLDKYEKVSLDKISEVPVPELDQELISESRTLEGVLDTLDVTNKKISQNNTYKKLQESIKLTEIPAQPKDSRSELAASLAVFNKDIQDSSQFIKKMQALHSATCPTCLSSINKVKVSDLVKEREQIIATSELAAKAVKQSIDKLDKETESWKQAVKLQEDWEKYYRLIDTTLPTTTHDKTDLQTKIFKLQKTVGETKKRIQESIDHNKHAEAHNSKVDIISKQLVEFTEELEAHSETLHALNERMSIINILTKTFSTNGLVAYKIESLVKDLEELTNKYLVDLSDGRFQITFQMSSKDKLNVIITDNGKDIEILALSGGERARVNAATLLAIRKLMQSLSKTRINLLILDETIEALDVDGKERLIETLLKEDSLNTFLVSHGFTHPLLEKVYVAKHNNISRIED
jgi:DNA repair exonuclease SbcCD ATPase subunit